MNVVITGGAGFLGQRLARKLLERGTLRGSDGTQVRIDRIALLDVVAAPSFDDPRVHCVAGDVADASLLRDVITAETHPCSISRRW